MFKIEYNDKCFEDILYLYKDESIISKKSGDWVLYFGSCWFALSINKKNGRVCNFDGYSSNFLPTTFLKIPPSKKGELYIVGILDGDGDYYPEKYEFQSEGFYDVNTGWYRVGAEYKSGEVIEIATNTLINLENGIIKAIYFKTQIAKE